MTSFDQISNPSDHGLHYSARAIAASLRDLESGETGRDADEVLNDLERSTIRRLEK